MNKIKIRQLGKIILFVFLAGLLILTGKDLYDSLRQAKKIDETLVESYQSSLDVSLVKKAAEVLKKER